MKGGLSLKEKQIRQLLERIEEQEMVVTKLQQNLLSPQTSVVPKEYSLVSFVSLIIL